MEIFKKMAESFDEERLSLKLVEELSELSEVLIKRVTRKEGQKPNIEKVIEELGDVYFRSRCLIEKLQISEQVKKRVLQKGIQVEKWYFTNNF